MEKQFKPVPDVECLKYHGTPEKPDIKIFVSHRIDLDSETIDNPLYIPVRCGAVYDEREGVTMLGDDTGENISEKRNSFCELTVQYWAWKNIEADYYGLCHYRRYLSFSRKQFAHAEQELVHDSYIIPHISQKYGLLDAEAMGNDIVHYDALISKSFDVRDFPWRNPDRNVLTYWKDANQLINFGDLQLLLSIMKEKYPSYISAADQYMRGHFFMGYNCFILKKKLFFDLCEFEFSILFDIEQKLDSSRFSEKKHRTIAYFSEILLSIWIYKNVVNDGYKQSVRQIIMFDKPKKEEFLVPYFAEKNIPIVIPSSDFYAPYAATCIQSIIYHSSEEFNYDLIILTSDMSESNKQLFRELKREHKNIQIRFYNPEPMIYPFKDRLYSDARVNLISFYRIAMPYFLIAYKKVVCVDSDLVFETDASQLFRIDIGEHYLAAVRDVIAQGFLEGGFPDFADYCKHEYDLKCRENYVNTGVGIYNLDALRARYSFDDVMNLSAKQKYFIQEQDVINLLVERNLLLLNEQWNVLTYCGDNFKDALEYAPLTYQKQYLAAREHPMVIHWAGWIKPWQKPDDDLAYRFWFYARMTPFYEQILVRIMWDIHNYNSTVQTYQSKARQLADRIFPKGTRRRNLAKRILPKGSRRWRFCKKIYQKIFRN